MIIMAFIIFAVIALFAFNGMSIALCDIKELPEDHQRRFIRTVNFLITILLISSYFELLIRLGKPL
ncbi:MAG: hypothetical protein ACO1OC_10605 [Tuberibacillus sp.]